MTTKANRAGKGKPAPKKKESNGSNPAQEPEIDFLVRVNVDMRNRRDRCVLHTFDCDSVQEHTDIRQIAYSIEGMYEMFDDDLAKQQAIQQSDMILNDGHKLAAIARH